MRFPIVRFDKPFGMSGRCKCTWCKKVKVCEPHSFAIIEGGSLLMNREEDYGGPDDNMDAYLDFRWHGAHPEDGGCGDDPDIDETVMIAKEVKGGQFDIYFCSTKCLRAFLNHAVDILEEKIARQREKS